MVTLLDHDYFLHSSSAATGWYCLRLGLNGSECGCTVVVSYNNGKYIYYIIRISFVSYDLGLGPASQSVAVLAQVIPGSIESLEPAVAAPLPC